MDKESSGSEEEGEPHSKMTFSHAKTNEIVRRLSTAAVAMVLLRWIMAVVKKFWALCATALLILLLCFWMYGSLIALLLLLLAIIGETESVNG